MNYGLLLNQNLSCEIKPLSGSLTCSLVDAVFLLLISERLDAKEKDKVIMATNAMRINALVFIYIVILVY
jgi:hypothetical protein